MRVDWDKSYWDGAHAQRPAAASVRGHRAAAAAASCLLRPARRGLEDDLDAVVGLVVEDLRLYNSTAAHRTHIRAQGGAQKGGLGDAQRAECSTCMGMWACGCANILLRGAVHMWDHHPLPPTRTRLHMHTLTTHPPTYANTMPYVVPSPRPVQCAHAPMLSLPCTRAARRPAAARA